MKILIINVVASFVCTALLTLVFCLLPHFKKNRKSIIKKSSVFAAVSALIVGGYCATILSYTIKAELLSYITVCLITCLCYLWAVVSLHIEHKKIRRFIKQCALISVVLLVVESFVFNLSSFTNNPSTVNADLSQATTHDTENIAIGKDYVSFIGDGAFTVDIKSENIKSVTLKLSGNDDMFKISALMTDENVSNRLIEVGSKYASTQMGSVTFSLNAYKELSHLSFSLEDVQSPVNITECVCSSNPAFDFSNARFLLLFSLLALICAIITFELYKIKYNPQSFRHKCATVITIFFCAAIMLCFFVPGQGALSYEGLDIQTQDPYIQMFDATINGRTTLSIEPSDELLKMDNPYDYSQRSDNGVDFAWDRAFYNGNYYSYYGIAPVLVFYFPFYFLTGMLPTVNLSCVIFGILSAVFLCLTILEFVRRFIKKPNLLLLIMCLVGACCSSGIYLSVNMSSFYVVAGIASTCFLSLCLLCGLRACNCRSAISRVILFIICALAFVLCLSSRPTKALGALILASVFIAFLKSRDYSVKSKLSNVAAFLLVVFAGVGAVMLYNNARFSSPFDFGAAYQLTVSNVSANSLRLSALPFAVIHYFFQPLDMTAMFPFIKTESHSLSNYGQYVYSDFSAGAFTFPLILIGTVLAVFLIFAMNKNKDARRLKNDGGIKLYTYLLLLFFAVLTAWLDFCMGGVIYSYVFDILPLLTLVSVFAVLDTQTLIEKHQTLRYKGVCALCLVSAATVIFLCIQLLSFHDVSLTTHYPRLYFLAEKLICFWC